METNLIENEFDLKQFQSEVYYELNSLLFGVNFARIYEEGPESVKLDRFKRMDNATDSAVVSVLVRGAIWFIRKVGKSYSEKYGEDEYIRIREKAGELMFKPEIRWFICKSLDKRIASSNFAEWVKVKIVIAVASLSLEEHLLNRYSFDKDPKLFAMLGYEVFRQGYKDFCESATPE